MSDALLAAIVASTASLVGGFGGFLLSQRSVEKQRAADRADSVRAAERAAVAEVLLAGARWGSHMSSMVLANAMGREAGLDLDAIAETKRAFDRAIVEARLLVDDKESTVILRELARAPGRLAEGHLPNVMLGSRESRVAGVGPAQNYLVHVERLLDGLQERALRRLPG